jgi:hypothetical protein
MIHTPIVRTLSVWLFCAVGMASVPAIARAADQPFVLTISAEPPAVIAGPDSYTVKAGSDVFINVQIGSISKSDLAFGNDYDDRFGVERLNHYEVRDSKGNPAQKRTIKHPELGQTGHGWPARALKPSASLNLGTDRITGLYDLTRPGKYTIQISRAISDNPENGFVSSNAITITVTE